MRGLIFMIDSEAINKELKDVAELVILNIIVFYKKIIIALYLDIFLK